MLGQDTAVTVLLRLVPEVQISLEAPVERQHRAVRNHCADYFSGSLMESGDESMTRVS